MSLIIISLSMPNPFQYFFVQLFVSFVAIFSMNKRTSRSDYFGTSFSVFVTYLVVYLGMMLIYDKFVKFLEQNNVKEIDTKDKAFDTDFHEAITAVPAQSDDQKGKIIDCVQKGYTLNDKVIRYAKVVVAQ